MQAVADIRFRAFLLIQLLAVCIVKATAVNDVRPVLLNSIRTQVALSADKPVSEISLCGAHRVFNRRAYYPKKFLDVLTKVNSTKGLCYFQRCLRGYFDIDSQEASVAQLLEWGVRRMSIDVHYIHGSGPDLRLCRGDPFFYHGCKSIADEVKPLYHIDVCGTLLGVPNLGVNSTGCTASSVAYDDGLRQISNWMRSSPKSHGQASDIIIIDFIDHVTGALHATSAATTQTAVAEFQEVLKRLFYDSGFLFSQAQLRKFRAQQDGRRWPTPRELLKQFNSARVIFLADKDSILVGDFVHAREDLDSAAGREDNSAKNYEERYGNSSCPATSNEFATVYESRKVLYLEEVDSAQTVLQVLADESGPRQAGIITADDAQHLLSCGISPSLERLTQAKIVSSCVWTWAEGTQIPSSSSNDCIVVNPKGLWTGNRCNRALLRKACRDKASPGLWRLSSVGKDCPSGFEFAIPASALEAKALATVLQHQAVSQALLPSVTGISTARPKKGSGSVSAGAVVGIVLAVVAVIVVVTVTVFVVRKRRASLTVQADDMKVIVAE